MPFALFALHHHPRGFVEMVVVDKGAFVRTYYRQLHELERVSTRFGIRNFSRPLNHHIPNTYRFFEKPLTKATYTYIMDVDVMLLDDVVPHFEAHFARNNTTVNNMIRKGTKRLTGMHFVKSDEYFTPALDALQDEHYASPVDNDERILYRIVERLGKLPPTEFQWRPIYGIHFSPSRGRNKSMDLRTTSTYKQQFIDVLNKYPSFKVFPIFRNMRIDLEEEFCIVT